MDTGLRGSGSGFGLEAFEPKSHLLDVMQATIRAISPGLPDLPAGWTASYTTWLFAEIA